MKKMELINDNGIDFKKEIEAFKAIKSLQKEYSEEESKHSVWNLEKGYITNMEMLKNSGYNHSLVGETSILETPTHIMERQFKKGNPFKMVKLLIKTKF